MVETDPADRLLDPALGAGALLDMGIYPLTLAHLVLGEPEQLAATANLSASGIDLDVSIAGLYPGGATAALTASMTSISPRTASVATEIGRFDLPRGFHHPDRLQWTSYRRTRGRPASGSSPTSPWSVGATATRSSRCIAACATGRSDQRAGAAAADLSLMRQMDDVRSQIGVTYRG